MNNQSIGSYQGKPIYAGTDANVSQQMFGTTPNVATPVVPTQISTQQLGADSGMQGSIQPPQIQQTPANIVQYSQAADNSIKLKEAEYKQAQDQVAQQESKMAPLNDMYLQLGMQSDQYNQQFQQGLNQQFQDLNQYKSRTQELQNKLNAFNTETDNAIRQQELMSLQGGAQTKGAQSTQNAVIIRERDIQANQIKAALAGATGQQALAQDAIDLYLKSKYDPAEQKIKNLERYINLNEKQLERKDSKALQAQRNLIDAEKTKLANDRSDDEAKQKIMATAAQFGAPNEILQSIGNAADVGSAIIKATGYMSDPVERQIKQAQLAKIYSDIRQNNIENQIKLQGANGTNIAGKPLKVSPAEITNLSEAITAKNSVLNLIQQFENNIGQEGTYSLYGAGAGEKDALKTNLALAMKNLEKTGALDKGTIDVLTGTLPDNKFWTTGSNQLKKLEVLKNTIDSKTTEYINSYKGTTAELDPRTKRAYQPIATPVVVDGYEFPDQESADKYINSKR